MVYTFGLVRHANIRYRDSLCRLAKCELQVMLHALSYDCDITYESGGGMDFLTFEVPSLSNREITFLSGHSSLALLAEKENETLRPLSFTGCSYLETDLPEILKYKGKTSVPFTRMMINLSLSNTPFCFSDTPLTLLDPLCGKGTSCFSAMQMGMNAVGLDTDQKALRESGDFFSRYLKVHMLKHSHVSRSETWMKSALPVSEYVFADTKEHFMSGDTRFFRLVCGDTSMAPALFRRQGAHLLVADLPYGVQHAPQFGHKPESFRQLLSRALPEWRKALLPGGGLALSFNTLTLSTDTVRTLVTESGFDLCKDPVYSHLRHEVEQAVVRDLVVAVNPILKGGSSIS